MLKSMSHNLKTPLLCTSMMLDNLDNEVRIEESIKVGMIRPAIKSCELLKYFI
jgi:hypothetical protein